jgi:hypothetical protein
MGVKKKLDFSEFPLSYQNKWVVLSSDEKSVLAADKSLAKAIEMARKKGEENPILLKMPGSGGLII